MAKELSKAEQKRKVVFDNLRLDMQQQGYKEKMLRINMRSANIFAAVLFLTAAVAFVFLYWIKNGNPIAQIHNDPSLLHSFMLLLGVILFTVLHELTHGVTWAIFCEKHFKSIEFGVKWKYLAPYCTCLEPLKRNQYLLGGIMPLIVEGLIPAFIGICIGNPWILLIGIVLTSGASGDLMCIFRLLTYKEKGDCIYYDHPYEVGLVVFER